MPRSCHAAVDLGAASGRVLVGTIGDGGIRLEEAHRFSYAPRAIAGHLVNQATANATGRPVVAGPVEATGLGNVLVQAAACGTATLREGRSMVRRADPPRRFDPKEVAAWDLAKRRYQETEAAALAAACKQGERVS